MLSQGQIKSFLISIKIAQFDFLNAQNKRKPLLLLDDIFEKIDEQRAQNLMEMVSESHFGQIFISDTHESRLEKTYLRFKFKDKNNTFDTWLIMVLTLKAALEKFMSQHRHKKQINTS